MGKVLGWLGGIFTIAYVVGLNCLTDITLEKFRALKLNEQGDFLAGAFGPLAILWLVLGYFQQGIELRQNSEALRLQAEELKNSVEQQKEMAAAAKTQAESAVATLEHQLRAFERERETEHAKAQPHLALRATGWTLSSSTRNYELALTNSGNLASNLRIHSTEAVASISPKVVGLLDRAQRATLTLTVPRVEKLDFKIEIRYSDFTGKPGVAFFGCVIENDKLLLAYVPEKETAQSAG